MLLLALLFVACVQLGCTANVPLHIKDSATISGSASVNSAQQGHIVAFSAVATDHLDAVSGDVTVVYPRVIINEGKGYNPLTGIFQAPVRGIYNFQVYCMSETNRAVGLDLYHNTNVITYFTYAAVPGGMGTGANSITLKLEKFDNVFLKLKKGHAFHNHANEHHNTFTGHILFELAEEKPNLVGNAININVG